MRKILWILGLLFVGYGWHITTTLAQIGPITLTVPLEGGVVTVEAGRMSPMGNGSAFSDGVVVTGNGIRIAADRAVFESPDHDGPGPERALTLEGNVRLTLPKQK